MTGGDRGEPEHDETTEVAAIDAPTGTPTSTSADDRTHGANGTNGINGITGRATDDAGYSSLPDVDTFQPTEPRLPASTSAPAMPPEPPPTRSPLATPAASAYRSPEVRNRSVYRRANPWYRRLARGLIATALLGATAIGVYFGARAVQDYLGRDRLPDAAPETPTIRESSFLITSTADDVELHGTLTVDFNGGAFEFIGLADSPNATDHLTSPDGETVYVRNDAGNWELLDGADPVVASIERAIELLRDDHTADTIFTNRLRRGYIDLIAETDEGEDDNRRTRYDVDLQLTSFAEAFPLQWEEFRNGALPGIAADGRHAVTVWVDTNNVLVGVDDPATGWRWERIAYSASAFRAFDPPASQIDRAPAPAQILAVECSVPQLAVAWTTALATCDEAFDTGRQLAVTAGLAERSSDPGAELAVATVCSVLQGDTPRPYDDPRYITLGGLLVDAGVCPGDTALLRPAD